MAKLSEYTFEAYAVGIVAVLVGLALSFRIDSVIFGAGMSAITAIVLRKYYHRKYGVKRRRRRR